MSYNISGMLLRWSPCFVGWLYGDDGRGVFLRDSSSQSYKYLRPFHLRFRRNWILSGANNAQGHPYSAFQDAPDHALDIGAHGMAPSDNASAAAASTGSVGWIARAYFLRAIYIGWCDAGRAGDAQDRSRPRRSQPDRNRVCAS